MQDQQTELQKQFMQLLFITEEMQQRIITLEKSNQILIKSQKQFIDWMEETLEDIEHFRENVSFEIQDNRYTKMQGEFWYPVIATEEDTLYRLIYERASIARFGDGEFSAIQGRIRHKFQTAKSEKLANMLKEVLNSNENNLLIAIADNYGNLDKYTKQAKREIRHYMTRQVRKEHLKLLQRGKIYYNAYITRPYVMYADNQTTAPLYRFKQLKKIWDNRTCIFVEGNKTGLGVGNDLFDNAKSIQRILAPSENAFTKYDQIIEKCLSQPTDSLFLIALGPTASVLAYALCKADYQAIDIGHLDLEYEWFLKGAGCRTFVEGKYNNEILGGEKVVAIRDNKYYNQVIADYS